MPYLAKNGPCHRARMLCLHGRLRPCTQWKGRTGNLQRMARGGMMAKGNSTGDANVAQTSRHAEIEAEEVIIGGTTHLPQPPVSPEAPPSKTGVQRPPLWVRRQQRVHPGQHKIRPILWLRLPPHHASQHRSCHRRAVPTIRACRVLTLHKYGAMPGTPRKRPARIGLAAFCIVFHCYLVSPLVY